MTRLLIPVSLIALLASGSAAQKLSDEQRMEMIRGLSSEYATAKIALPRSKDPLVVNADGTFDKAAWNAIGRQYGPAARLGDLVQITKMKMESDEIILEINGGAKAKRSWRDRVQVGVGTQTRPISGNPDAPMAAMGTTITLKFDKNKAPQDPATVKQLLSQVLDFERRSATEQYVDKLPPEQKKAIEEKRAIEGMDRDAVILALGKPNKKYRDNKDGEETEDWIYGAPPGKVVFITFKDDKVAQVRELYGMVGGSTVPTPIK